MCSETVSCPSAPVIELRNLGKKYPIYDRPAHKLMEWMTLRRKRFHREFWALRGVDLEISAGSSFGIIGQNGSGKSTLLQILAGILQHNEGECRVEGKVAALLELGAGFNLEFSGLENIYLNGTVLGLTRHEIDQRLDQILDFAEIGDFIYQPVKTYSSGMFMRLAFSVAIHVDPEILLVDEALAVGDLVFQHRCISRMRRLREAGKTIILVTHDLDAISRFCDRAMLLDAGLVLAEGEPEGVIQAYRKLVAERERKRAGAPERVASSAASESLPTVRTIPYVHHRYGEGGGKVLGIILISPEGQVLNEVRPGQKVRLLVSVAFSRPMSHPIIGFTLRDRVGVEVTSSNTSYEEVFLPPGVPGEVQTAAFDCQIPYLRPGSYSISPALSDGDIWNHTIHDWIDNAYILNVVDTGLVYGQMKWELEVRYSRNASGVADSESLVSGS